MEQHKRVNQNDPRMNRLETLEIVVSEMDTQLHHLQALVQIMTSKAVDSEEQREDIPENRSSVMRDDVWACSNCAARLGIYNPEKEELRVRYKDFVAYVKPGVGGTIMVPCRRCGEQNTLSDTRDNQS